MYSFKSVSDAGHVNLFVPPTSVRYIDGNDNKKIVLAKQTLNLFNCTTYQANNLKTLNIIFRHPNST